MKTNQGKLRQVERVGLIGVISVLMFGAMFIDIRPKPEVERILPNFHYFETTTEKKREFFNFMRPIIEAENDRIKKQRKRLEYLYLKKVRGEKLTDWDRAWIKRFIEEYGLKTSEKQDLEVLELLLTRIDIIPPNLALAQSAVESGWGTSRFAKEGNSMFGQWSYSRSNPGMVPEKRNPNARHTVAEFKSVSRSVRAYMRNLNSHFAYERFRRIRAEFRENGETPDGYLMAIGLLRYSERRDDYVREIRKVIRLNEELMGLN